MKKLVVLAIMAILIATMTGCSRNVEEHENNISWDGKETILTEQIIEETIIEETIVEEIEIKEIEVKPIEIRTIN